MTVPVKEVELVPVALDAARDKPAITEDLSPGSSITNKNRQAVARAEAVHPQGSDLVLMFERLAKDPAVDVEKLERLIAMQERILKFNAEAAFNADFVEMQPHIPVIEESRDGDSGKWHYAPLEDIVEVVRPILSRHGFTLTHKTEWPDAKTVKVVGILTHRQGHARYSEFQSLSDPSGSKNAIQALGSSVSYGKRYTTKDLLCIVTRKEDDDGTKSEKATAGDPPAGYDEWQLNMEAVADEGWPALSKAFGKSSPEYRNRATRTDNRWWNKCKAKAEAVKDAR